MAGRTLVNAGHVEHEGGRVRGNGGSLIDNRGEWIDRAALRMNSDYGPNMTFRNSGVYRKQGDGEETHSVRWEETGLSVIEGGHLTFNGPGDHDGELRVPAGASVDFSGSHVFHASHLLGGAGRIRFTGGSITLDATLSSTNIALQGATLRGDRRVTGLFRWISGQLNSGSTTVAPGASMVIEADVDHDMPSHSLTNLGSVLWTGGRVRGGGGSMVVNEGAWRVDGGTALNNDYGGSHVLSNSGTWITASGSLAITVNPRCGGEFRAEGGAEVRFTTGITMLNNVRFTGAGFHRLQGGVTTASGTVFTANLIQEGSRLRGDISIDGRYEWISGDWNDGGPYTILAGSTLRIAGGVDHDMAGSVIRNSGTVQHEAGRIRMNAGSRIENSGEWTVPFDAVLNNDYGGAPGVFVNTGAYRKTGGDGDAAFGIAFRNEGVMEALSGGLSLSRGIEFLDGSLRIVSGNLTVPGTFEIQGGTVAVNGRINGSVINSGLLSAGASPGSLVISGNYSQTGDGTLDVELGGEEPGEGYDQVIVNGSATLAGRIQARLANGFIPPTNSVYDVVLPAQRTGEFGQFSYPVNLFTAAMEYPGEVAQLRISNVFVTDTNTLPDIVVRSVVATPSPARSGGRLLVNWLEANTGGGTLTNATRSRVVIRNASGTVLGETTMVNPAANVVPGASASRQASVTLPDGPVATGLLTITVTADSFGDVAEQNRFGTGEQNNDGVGTVESLISPYPDLQVTGLTVTPLAWLPGQTVTVSWRTTNSGTRATAGDWLERLFVQNANGATVADGTTNYFAAAEGAGAIEAGGYRQRSVTFTMPANASAYGRIRFSTTTDSTNSVFEYFAEIDAETNNTAFVEIVSSPDLTVSNVVLSAVGGLRAGGEATVTWRTYNMGNAPAVLPFSERVQIRNADRDIALVNDQPSLDAAADPIPVGGFQERSARLRIPDGVNGAGLLRAVVMTDITGIYNEAQDGGEANNSASGDAVSELPAYPDLRVAGVTLGSGAPVTGGSVLIRWTITNAGNAATAAPWVDVVRVRRVADGSILANLSSAATSGATNLGAGQVLQRELSWEIPDAPAYSGELEFVVQADGGNYVFEYVAGEDAEQNNTGSVRANVALAPQPNLSVTGISGPNSARPGSEVAVRYTVLNSGAVATSVPFRETVWLSPDGSPSGEVLGVFDVSGTLATNAPAQRERTVVIPERGGAGNLRFVVVVDSAGSVAESNEVDNTGTSGPVAVPLELRFAVSPQSVPENFPGTLLATVSRNGDTASPLTVSVTYSPTNAVSGPSSVVIPAGGRATSIPLTSLPDGIPAGPKDVTLTVRATGFRTTGGDLFLSDVDVPRLTLSLTSTNVLEGQGTEARVTRDGPTHTAAVVSLQGGNPNALEMPSSVTIPVGSTGAVFVIATVDNRIPEATRQVPITASASGYVSSTAGLRIEDNDSPVLTLTLARNSASEGAGPLAVSATIERSVAEPVALIVRLASSRPEDARVPVSVTIPAGQARASFHVATVDNATVDGSRDVTITATVNASSGEVLAAAPPKNLTVTDDDGPTISLQLARSLVREGDTNIIGLVQRNTATNLPLNVTLAVDPAASVALPASVTIPAGARSATFAFGVPSDGVTAGNRTATLTARASGFVEGGALLVITDGDLPDLVVGGISAPTNVITGEAVSIGLLIENRGYSTARGRSLQQVFIVRDPSPSGEPGAAAEFVGEIPAGAAIGQTLVVPAPSEPGDYWIVAVADAERRIEELLDENNTAVSALRLRVERAYGVTVAADVDSASAGTSVALRGIATLTRGGPAALQLVNVHVTTRGTRRVISARTDSEGRFVTEFVPLPLEAGRYGVGADHPGVAEPAEQDSFVLLGMTGEQAPLLVVDEGGSGETEFRVQNLAPLPLTGLTVSVDEPVAGISVIPSLPAATLAGDGTLSGRIVVNVPTGTLRGGIGFLVVRSAEGPSVRIPYAIRVDVRRPVLVATPAAIEGGAARGRRSTFSFAVTNTGAISTGPLRVLLPGVPWLNTTVAGEMPPIAPGEGRVITLLASPPEDQPLGLFEGSVVVGDSQAGVNVGLKLRVLSEQRGDLTVTATDEYTFYAEGAPRVTNALVTVRSPITFAAIIDGRTDTHGRANFSGLLEDDYIVEVSADGHNPFRTTASIRAGRTNEVEAFLSRELVRYTWTVNPTSIEDTTRIDIETTFETAVPVPVVTMEPTLINLSGFEGSITQINLTLRNQGLIAADNTRIVFEQHPNWTFRTLVTNIGRLPALTTITVPLVIERRPSVAGVPPGPCSIGGAAFWDLWCGDRINTYTAPVQITGLSPTCNEPASAGRLAQAVGSLYRGVIVPNYPPGGGTSWSPGGAGGVFVPSSPTAPSVLCDPCFRARSTVLANCTFSLGAPLASRAPATFICGKDSLLCVVGSTDAVRGNSGSLVTPVLDCSRLLASCPGSAALVGASIEVLRCANNLYSACDNLVAPRSKTLDPLERFDLAKSASVADLGDIPGHMWRLSAAAATYTNFMGGDRWFAGTNGVTFENWYAEFARLSGTNSAGRETITANERTALLALPLPGTVDAAEAARFVERWNRTVEYWSSGIFSAAQVPSGGSRDFIDLDLHYALATNAVSAVQMSQSEGRPNLLGNLEVALADFRNLLETDTGSGVCARVRLRLTQEAVVTRDAFQATLELANDTAGPLEEIAVEISVRDALGVDTTPLFVIRPPTIDNLGATDGTGVLAPHSTGSAGWLLIPSHDAAPTGPVEHYVSGTLRYRQNGVLISIPLAPARINVMPNAQLTLKYFHERDVYSDDPFTGQIEPSVPFNLAVMVKNSGYGVARNLRITSAQPEIIENERGLAIDFRIIGSEVAGQPQSPSLQVAFGDVDPGQIKIARWLLTSSLQGLFTDYKATFENLSGLGDRSVSIIQNVEIHEMNRLVEADGVFQDGQPDFLVNDQPDVRDRPDTLHLSSGEVMPVSVSTRATTVITPTAASPVGRIIGVMSNGWTYLRIADPSGGELPLLRVRRQDGSLLPAKNAWTTDRTFIGLSHRPLVEPVLHLLDYNYSSGVYTLEYGQPPVADESAPSSRVAALAENSSAEFQVVWNGLDGDEGSGIAGFDVFVSENGAPFAPWLMNTSDLGALYRGRDGLRYAFYSIARDRAGNVELPPASADAVTLVSITNRPPVASLPAVVIADEGSIASAQITANDPDAGQTLSFAIGVGGTPSMRIDPVTGMFGWPTTESDGPSTNQIQIIVTDNGLPPRSVTVPLVVIVREVNSAPAVDPVTDLAVNELMPISFAVTARDSDLPAQTLSYRLGSGAPAGAAISAAGVFTWRPDRSQGPSTNEIAVEVSDNGSPVLTAVRRFTIVVRDSAADFVVRLGNARVNAGDTASIPVSLETVESLRSLTLDIAVTPAGRLAAGAGFSVNSASIAGVTVQPLPDGGVRVQMDAQPGSPISGSSLLGSLTLPTVADAPSAVLRLLPAPPVGRQGDGIELIEGEARFGRLIYVSDTPVLTVDRAGGVNTLGIHNPGGRRYRVERSGSIRGPVWTQLIQTAAGNQTTETVIPESLAAEFFRAVEAP